MKAFGLLLVAVALVSSVSLPVGYLQIMTERGPPKDFFFGVTFGGNTTAEAELLIDRVKDYTNLFVVDSWDIATNETALTEICDYAVKANLNVIVYFDFIFINDTRYAQGFNEWSLEPFHTRWLNESRDRYGDKFLGVYLVDEPGGKQIDFGNPTGNVTDRYGRPINIPRNFTTYSSAANWFVRTVGRSQSMQRLINSTYPYNIANTTHGKMPVFTADNTLYWFDYLSNYDVVFAELGWNHNIQQHIALCRGAATAQNKTWGAIITWAYNKLPYLSTGPEMLQDMQTAYSVGAKYVIVFNFPQINPYGALADEHFSAMKTFWDQIHGSPRSAFGEIHGEVAFVLPKDYGWGMRQPDDNIWGYWPADNQSQEIGRKMQAVRNAYGLEFDAVYDDPRFNLTGKYSELYYWNSSADFSKLKKPNEPVDYGFYTALISPPTAVTCVVAVMFLRRKKQQSPKTAPDEPMNKAKIAKPKKLNPATVELFNDMLRFHATMGRFKKRPELIKEFPIANIEGVSLTGKDFRVSSAGTAEVFLVESAEQAERVCKRVTEALDERRKTLEAMSVASQKRNELAKTLGEAMDMVDSLFDVLLSLHGQVDWNRVDGHVRLFEERCASFKPPESHSALLDCTGLSEAAKARKPTGVSTDAVRLLKSLYDNFASKPVSDEFSEQLHPNVRDLQAVVLAYYALNDIVLGVRVGDKEITKESIGLVSMLGDLAKSANVGIDIDSFKKMLDQLISANARENLVSENRAMFRQQLRELLTVQYSQTPNSA